MEWMLVLILEGQQPFVLGRGWPDYSSCSETAAGLPTQVYGTKIWNEENRSEKEVLNLRGQRSRDGLLLQLHLHCLPYNKY